MSNIIDLVYSGDRILVQPHGSASGHWFEGRAFAVRREEVVLRFHHSFRGNPGQQYHIRFKLNRIPIRRSHLAMDSAFAQDRVLFPSSEHLLGHKIQSPQRRVSATKLTTYNPLIAKNPPQLQAVTSIVEAAAGSIPFVIFGP